MVSAPRPETPRTVRDYYGRSHRVGERATDLTGHPREWQAACAWACLAAVSPLQYAFGLVAIGLRDDHAWGAVPTMWLFAAFVACQATAALPVAFLRRLSFATPPRLMVAGGLLAALAQLTLAHEDNIVLALLGYSLAGGVGAGLVYATGISTAARWFPERRVTAVGFVTGGFACGAVPVLVLLTILGPAVGRTVVLDAMAVLTLLTTLLCGRVLREPPVDWWPDDVDAQLWVVDHRLNPSLPRNVPAMQTYAPRAALRTGALPLMWVILALTTAVSLLMIAFLGDFAVSAGLGLGVAGASAALLATTSGVVRAFTGRLSDRFGRRPVLAVVLAIEGITAVGLAWAGGAGFAPGYLLCALLAGVGGGAFYAIFNSLVVEYFGETSLVQNQAVLYSAKAVGGLIGVGMAAWGVGNMGYVPVFATAGVVSIAAAALVRLLRQPGRNVLARYAATGLSSKRA